MYLMYRLPFVECLMFGALISATDPVTVLSIFQVMSFTYCFNSSFSILPLLHAAYTYSKVYAFLLSIQLACLSN